MMNPSRYRDGLPTIPKRMLSLPVLRGYPVPYFVDQNPNTVEWDFRIFDGRKLVKCVKEKRCWLCGNFLGRNLVFVIGPMCAINRVSSEPPSHPECADFAARACPFLSRPHEKRRGNPVEEFAGAYCRPAAGLGLDRNPGVALVWMTLSYRVFKPHLGNNGVLFQIGDPVAVAWYAEGRPAKRSEIEHSIETGFPFLMDAAKLDGQEAVQELMNQREEALSLFPAV